ncbi:MAG: tRNA pseudouridine synthase A [Clostridia bacterium]|nr:tRNA pseudouridine synthase A [Clostridia bacterium]
MTVRLFLRYDGSGFSGWQIQNEGGVENPLKPTVQGTLNNALRTLLGDDSLKVTGCSRTDAGVHALDYCASFDVGSSVVPVDKICLALRPLLPETLTVFKSEPAPEGFNARYDTVKKTYKYLFYCGTSDCPPVNSNAWFVKTQEIPGVDVMNRAASYLLGTHDFSAFCGDLKNAKTTVRTLFECKVEKKDPFILANDQELYEITVTGDGFLYNMVRIIAGPWSTRAWAR